MDKTTHDTCRGERLSNGGWSSSGCGRPATMKIVDEYYRRVYYACGYHAGVIASHRATIHVIAERGAGECLRNWCRQKAEKGTPCKHTKPGGEILLEKIDETWSQMRELLVELFEKRTDR